MSIYTSLSPITLNLSSSASTFGITNLNNSLFSSSVLRYESFFFSTLRACEDLGVVKDVEIGLEVLFAGDGCAMSALRRGACCGVRSFPVSVIRTSPFRRGCDIDGRLLGVPMTVLFAKPESLPLEMEDEVSTRVTEDLERE